MPKIEKILKKQEDGTKKTIYPATICQAIRDGKTGASLEALLSQFNSIYVQYNGTAFDTRNLIPESMRRAGLVITYMNMDSETITERAVSAVQADNDHWGLNVNWTRIDQFTLSGRITISSEGTWLVDGEDTGIKAVGPKGDTGLTPWLKTIDNKLHFSYDNVTWEPCSENIAAWFRWNDNKIQISRDNKTWTDLSGKFADNVHIKGYVANYASLPTGAVQGEIYGVGPTYAAEDTAHSNPIYRYYVRNANTWVDNGSFTSLSAGVVQETGASETEVMSQKAVSTKLSELGSEVDELYTNFLSKTEFDGVNGALVIDKNGKVTSVPSENYKIGYYIARENIKIGIVFTRNNDYVYSGMLCKAASVDNITDGGVLTVITQFEYNKTSNKVLDFKKGEVLAVGYVVGSLIDNVDIKLYDNKKIDNIEKELSEQIKDLNGKNADVSSLLDIEKTTLMESDFIDDLYRNTSGDTVENTSYFKTVPLWIKKGTYVNITTSFKTTNKVSIISKVESDGTFITSELIGTGETQNVKIFIEEDGYYEISTLKSVKPFIYIGISGSMSKIFNSVSDVQNSVDVIKESYYKDMSVLYKDSVIINSEGMIQSVSSVAYKIGYYTALKDSKVKVTFTRNSNYIYSGTLCKATSVDDIIAGNTLEVIHFFPYGQKQSIEILLNEGQTIAISLVKGSVVDEFLVQLYNSDIISEIEKGLEEINKVSTPTDYNGGDFSAFTKILCIGDSLTQGVFNYDKIEGQSFSANKEYSYPSNLRRISGCETINLGVAGITSSGWYDRFIDDERVIGCDCCIIALGVNDDRNTLETTSRNAFINIIELVKNKNKGIKIFLSGIINGKSYSAISDSGYKEKDQFIRNLYNELYANDSQVFFIDMVKYGHLQNLESMPSSSYPIDNYNMGHLSAYGYWRLAKDFYNYISYIMANDKNNVFRNIQFTGTDFYFKIP